MSAHAATGDLRATDTAAAPPDVFHVARDVAYDRLVAEEAAFWDKPQVFGVDVTVPETAPYFNRRHTGDARRPWHDVIADYGSFRRGLALGTSGLKLEASILRRNPELHLTFCDISTASLAQRADVLGGEFPGRVETRAIDLNFAEFTAESFDLILSASSVHHMANLEHVAYQANRALTPEGYFFLQDYVAEAHFDFAPEKRRIFEATFAEMRRRHPEMNGWRIEWPRRDDLSPFEAVRSDETLDVLRRYLREERLHLSGALLTMTLLLRYDGASGEVFGGRPRSIGRRVADMARPRARAGDRSALLAAIAPELTMLDGVLSDAGVILPSHAFGIYRKRT